MTRIAEGDFSGRRRGARRVRTSPWAWVGDIVFTLVGALILSTVLRMFVFQVFVIPSGSMENTLRIGDRVVATKVVQVKRGDVVVFKDFGGWLGTSGVKRDVWGQVGEFIGVLPNESTEHLVKRVIGTPGDTVTCCNAQGRLTVNGVAIDESEYLYRDAAGRTVAPSAIRFTVVVPAGRLFVMGDHRNASADSRCHLAAKGIDAFVPIDQVVGPVVTTAWPVARWRWFGTPAAFANVPAPTNPAPAAPVIEPADVHC